MRVRNGSRWSLLLLPALLLVTACGVPISAEEVTATAESMKTSQQLSTIGEAAVSSRGSEALGDPRFSTSPVPTLAALGTPGTGTPQPSGTPNASATPGASATPAVSATPSVTPSPEPSGTPGTPTVTSTPSPQPTAGVPSSGFGAEVVTLVNKYRAERGLPALRADPYITTASNNYANVMATQRANVAGVSHTGPDGTTSEQRLAASGYGGAFCGENLAAGQASAQDAVNIWKNSPAHNAIMLAANPTEIGVGYFYNPNSYYKHYWVLMTGRPSDLGCPPS